MDKYFAVFSSDEVTKDGRSFSISALEDGVWQAAVYGIPSNLSHDIHKPVGWSYPKGLYFKPRNVLTLGYFLIADKPEDEKVIASARRTFFTNLINKEIAPHADRFKTALDNLFIEKSGNWFYNGLVLYGYENIVFKAFPDLEAHIFADKDGLVNLDYLLTEFEYLSQGVFKKRNSELTIIAHPYFRKSLSIYNNFHCIFLDELISLHGNNQDLRLKIKIDPDFIGFAPSFIETHEFEYWWGPQYDDDITKIKPGLTQYGSDEFEKLYYNIDRSEFVWKSEDNLYTFEMEEVKDEQAPTLIDTYACRYIHSIYDTNKNGFDHFDGAIRGYSTELIVERLDKKMTEMGRRSDYTKLFRVDGNLPLSNWKSLVTNYLQGNPQIYEYFGLPKPGVQKMLEDEAPTVFEKYIPYSINKDDGVRLYVSYHAKHEHQPHERFVSITDEITLEDGKKNAIEYFTFELKKAIIRLGSDLILPQNCIYLLPEDYYANIPCVFHSDINNEKLLNESVQALRNLVNNLMLRSKREVISATFAWNTEDKEVRLSMLGHISDLKKWLDSFETIPVERKAFKNWLTQQAIHIKTNGVESKCPVLSSVVYTDGVLYMKRRLVQKDVNLTFPDKNDPMLCEIEYEESQSDLKKSVTNGEIYIAPNILIEKMLCLKSGLDYAESPYSVILDDDTNQKIEKCKLVSFHWTDKPRPVSFG